MNYGTAKLGGLDCQSIDALPAGAEPRMIVVLCHGFGAPANDLVPLGPELLYLNPALADKVRFLFPAAPLSLDEWGMFGGRAWWPLDIERFNAAIATGEFRNLRHETPAGMPEARQLLMNLVTEVAKQTGLPYSAFVLGGFSQGAMLAMDVGLRLPAAPAGLCIFSGTLVCEQEWHELAAKRGTLPVLQSHGTQDPILPFPAAIWLRDMLQEAGMDVEFIPFQGPHTIAPEAMHRFAAMLGRLAE
ncbi:MAG: dienelactone hydrolase family protein [Planctomycetaceae bacterium]